MTSRIKTTRKVSYTYNKNKQIPKILLTGDWLRKCGFEYEDNYLINVKKNKIIITKLHNINPSIKEHSNKKRRTKKSIKL